jgi:hypothetical protein
MGSFSRSTLNGRVHESSSRSQLGSFVSFLISLCKNTVRVKVCKGFRYWADVFPKVPSRNRSATQPVQKLVRHLFLGSETPLWIESPLQMRCSAMARLVLRLSLDIVLYNEIQIAVEGSQLLLFSRVRNAIESCCIQGLPRSIFSRRSGVEYRLLTVKNAGMCCKRPKHMSFFPADR